MDYIPAILFLFTVCGLLAARYLPHLLAMAMAVGLTIALEFASSFTNGAIKQGKGEAKEITPMLMANAHVKVATLYMTFAVSIIAVVISMIFIATDTAGETGKNWAFGTMGTVFGFWLGVKKG